MQAAFAHAARYLSALTAGDPHGSAAALLTRPDVDAELKQALDSGRQLAQDAVREAWGGAPRHQYLDWLLSDVDRSYNSLAVLRAAVRVGWHSSPDHASRADAVCRAVLAHGADLALRNRLSAESATTAARTQAELASGEQLDQAGEQAWKRWECSHNPPDDRTCHWCRSLHGMTIPLHAQFPAGEPADLTGHGRLTQPPRLYRGVLPGPPRHPRCRCRVVVTTILEPVESEAGGQETMPVFLAAASVRALPEDRYQALAHFLEAAVHELGQVLGRLREVARGRG